MGGTVQPSWNRVMSYVGERIQLSWSALGPTEGLLCLSGGVTFRARFSLDARVYFPWVCGIWNQHSCTGIWPQFDFRLRLREEVTTANRNKLLVQFKQFADLASVVC